MDYLQTMRRVRRGQRIPRRLPLLLHWREPQGAFPQVPAETMVLSQHGCLLSCSARIKLPDEVIVWWLEGARYTKARVVFRTVNGDGSVKIALEFLDSDDFWALDFGPQYAAMA